MNRDRDVLERRYRRLLYAYPAAYRRHRGAEILDTLLHEHPGGRWPSRREACALLSGGLRARSGISQPMPLRVSLRHIALLAVLLFIGQILVVDLRSLADVALWQPRLSWSAFVSSEWWTVAAISAYAGTAVLVSLRRPGLALATLAIPTAMAAYLYVEGGSSWDLAMAIVAVAVPAATVSRRRLPPLPRGWLWLVGLFTAASSAWSIAAEGMQAGPRAWQVASLLQVYGPWLVVAIWTIIDARPALAVVAAASMVFVADYLAPMATYLSGRMPRRYADYLPIGPQIAVTTWTLLGACILVVAAAARLRRLAAV